MSNKKSQGDALVGLVLAYSAASLFHFAHNGIFIADYPNLPPWLSATMVYAAWGVITFIGIAGSLLMWLGLRMLGLIIIALYALLGFDGLGHYQLAPFFAHTPMMNLSICLEVFAASVLLIVVLKRVARLAGQTRFKASV